MLKKTETMKNHYCCKCQDRLESEEDQILVDGLPVCLSCADDLRTEMIKDALIKLGYENIVSNDLVDFFAVVVTEKYAFVSNFLYNRVGIDRELFLHSDPLTECCIEKNKVFVFDIADYLTF